MIKKQVELFYSKYPYPSQNILSLQDLFKSKHKKVMEQILFCSTQNYESLKGIDVLDAGCGTGEKSLFLSYFGARVDAFDISPTSISIAKKTAKKLGLRVNFFVQSFENFKTTKKYDLILAIGSLHHSANPKENFLKLSNYLKKDGVIVVGLYNLYGRFFIRIVRFLLKLIFKTPSKIVDFLLKFYKPPTKTAIVLLADKYAVPHESYHTIGEVLGWFREANLKPLAIYPPIKLDFVSIFSWQLFSLFTKKGFFFISAKKQKTN
ncbi:MAG: methyltransferase domain-containing protein [Candidatus Anstonellaceae archaeon]